MLLATASWCSALVVLIGMCALPCPTYAARNQHLQQDSIPKQNTRSQSTSRRNLKEDASGSDAVSACRARYPGFLPGIEEDLMLWAGHGINETLMNKTLEFHSYHKSNDGVPIVFKGGVPYAVGSSDFNKLGPGLRRLLVVYLHVMVHLSKKYGSAIPDVELVIAALDAPGPAEVDRAHMPPVPVFRYCKTDRHAEITIPCWYMYDNRYSATYLATAAKRQAELPWHKRKQVLFSIPGGYDRVAESPLTRKLNYTGEATRFPRLAFAQWAQVANDSLLEVSQDRWLHMPEWAAYRYVAHVDGITCSCRLEKLLALGSLVVKEESGYRSFYHRLLQPMVHYVPFWHRLPQEALEAVHWAVEHDERARQIGENAARLMQRYMTKAALDCFWLMLLDEYSKLFTFKPAGPGRAYSQPLVPLTQVLEEQKGATAGWTYLGTDEIELQDPEGMEDPWSEM